jgi:hypothetical protein
MKNIKNFTPQPNAIFDLDLPPMVKLIILYLNSNSDNWRIYKSQVQSKFEISDKKMDEYWKQLQQLELLTKHRTYNKKNPKDNCVWKFHKNVLTNICANSKNAGSEIRLQQNALPAENTASVIACLPTTNGSPTTNGETIMNDELITTRGTITNDITDVKRWILNNNVPTSSIIQQQFPELTEEQISTLRNEAVDESFYL